LTFDSAAATEHVVVLVPRAYGTSQFGGFPVEGFDWRQGENTAMLLGGEQTVAQ